MLLSMFISFLLARRFGGKMYVPLMIVGLVLVSFFSVGVPEYMYILRHPVHQPISTDGVLPNNPLPLSFPFYSSVYHRRPMEFRDLEWEDYRLNFLTLILQETRIVSVGARGSVLLSFSWNIYFLYFTFFLLVNIIGAIIGYWLSKATLVDKLLKRTNASIKQDEAEH